MNNETLGFTLVLLGIFLCLAAWTFFRHKEHKFITFVPFLEAHQYMRQPGGTLWWTGIVLLILGILNTWSAR